MELRELSQANYLYLQHINPGLPMPKLRKYQAIWLTLKATGGAVLTAAPDRHKTIIQAVRKERANDIPFRIAEKRLGKRHTLKYSIGEDGYTLTFTLIDLHKI